MIFSQSLVLKIRKIGFSQNLRGFRFGSLAKIDYHWTCKKMVQTFPKVVFSIFWKWLWSGVRTHAFTPNRRPVGHHQLTCMLLARRLRNEGISKFAKSNSDLSFSVLFHHHVQLFIIIKLEYLQYHAYKYLLLSSPFSSPSVIVNQLWTASRFEILISWILLP